MSEYTVNSFKTGPIYLFQGGHRTGNLIYENIPANSVVFIRRLRPFLENVFMIFVGNNGMGLVGFQFVGGQWIPYNGTLHLDTQYLYATAYEDVDNALISNRESVAYQVPNLFTIRAVNFNSETDWVENYWFAPSSSDLHNRRLLAKRFDLTWNTTPIQI